MEFRDVWEEDGEIRTLRHWRAGKVDIVAMAWLLGQIRVQLWIDVGMTYPDVSANFCTYHFDTADRVTTRLRDVLTPLPADATPRDIMAAIRPVQEEFGGVRDGRVRCDEVRGRET